MNMSLGTQKPIEVQDFKFITHSKIQVYENHVQCSIPNLVVAASRFGLIFTARLNEVKVIQLTSIAQSSLKDKKVPLRTQCLAGYANSLALNCDHTVLAISIFINDIRIIQFYDVTSYYKETITLLNEVRVAYAPLQISWNPCIANVVAATLEDGSLWACELNGTALNINGTENTARAVSLSWSPKGKQIVIGTQENSLCQFKPDLKLVKTIVIPNLKGAIISVQWLSNYQFATVFHDKSNPDDVPRIIIVNAPKTGPVFSFQYEDIFYSSREQDTNYISFLHQQAWSVLLVLSLNSSEIAVLGGTNVQDVCNWEQWLMTDDARAEIPLFKKDESYPCGFALDTGITKQITIGDNQTLQPMPMLHLLSDRGLLISFDVINTRMNGPSICCPPEPIRDGSGLHLFVQEIDTNQEQVKSDLNNIPVQVEITNNVQIVPPKPVAPQQGVGDFSFLGNKPAVTSTPEKSLDLRNQGKENKPEPVMFGKPLSFSSQMNENKPPTQKPSNADPRLNLFSSQNAPVNNSSFFKLPNQLGQVKVDETILPNRIMPVTETKTINSNQVITQALEQVPVNSFGSDKINKEEENINKIEDSAENNEAIMNLIQTETNFFYKEFKEVMERSRLVDIQCGEEIESNLLNMGVSELKSFIEEANESTQNQRSEVQTVRRTLMEAFSWISEAKCKYGSMNSDSSISSIDHIQSTAELDLLSKRQLSAITKLLYYIESQITQFNKQTDERWSDFQEKCKARAKGTMHIPSMESLYQTLLKQGDILSRQKKLVEDMLIKIKRKSSGQHPMYDKGNVVELSNLLNNMKVSTQDFAQIHKERVLQMKSQFTKIKHEALLKNLSNRSTLKVIPVKINYNDCKSSMVLDRIKKIRDKKLSPTKSTIKANDFKVQLNEYMEKQSLLNQQNAVANASKNLLNLFDKTKPDSTTKINTSAIKTIPDKQIPALKSVTTAAPVVLEKPKPTMASFPTLNLSNLTKPVTKPIAAQPEKNFGISQVQPAPVSTLNNSFSSLSASISNNSKSVPTTSVSAFSVITPKQIPLKFGGALTEEKSVSGFTLKTNAPVFSFTSPTTQPKQSITTETNKTEIPIKKEEPKEPTKDANKSLIPNVNKNSTFIFDASSLIQKNVENKDSSTNLNASIISKPIPKIIPVSIPSKNSDDTKDSVTITPISSTTPVSNNSFSFISPASSDLKIGNLNTNSVTSSVFSNTIKPLQEEKPVIVSKESTPPATSADSVFSFNLEDDTFSNNSGLRSTTSTPSETKLDVKICSPSSFMNVETKTSDNSKTSVFGMNALSTGSPTTSAPATTASTGFGVSSSSMFGSSAFGVKSPQTSIFGGASNLTNTGSTLPTTNIFGQGNKNEVVTTSVFGGAAPATGNVFGSGSVFGAKSPEAPKNSFDMTSSGTPTTSMFGSPASSKTETNIFGGGPLKPATAMFGQQASFGNTNATGGSIFGGGTASAQTNTGFGFGSPTSSATSVFGGTSSGGFGSGGSMFGSGAFSGGGGSVAQGGFGSPLAMGKSTPGGFGSPPSFGSQPAAPAFGGSPSFGSSPTFGSTPAFGSPTSNVFANASQPTAFTTQTQQSSTFETLAQSNVISFGNLAQGSGAPQQPKPASFTGSSSFSSWR